MAERREHTYYECGDSCDGCGRCLGGLTWCTVCGGAEGCLAPDCPGVRLTMEQLDVQYAEFFNAGKENRPARNMWEVTEAEAPTMPTNPTRLTPAREAEIRALVDALPREHWVQEMEQDLSLCADGTVVSGKPYPVGRVTAFYEYDAGNGTIGEDEREVATFDATRDAAFFIAAPNALRDLLAEVEALRALLIRVAETQTAVAVLDAHNPHPRDLAEQDERESVEEQADEALGAVLSWCDQAYVSGEADHATR